MNKSERYFMDCVESLKELYGDNIKEISSKVRQLSNQARGLVRDCFIVDFQDYALKKIVEQERNLK